MYQQCKRVCGSRGAGCQSALIFRRMLGRGDLLHYASEANQLEHNHEPFVDADIHPQGRALKIDE